MWHGVSNICEWGGVGGRETERERKMEEGPSRDLPGGPVASNSTLPTQGAGGSGN